MDNFTSLPLPGFYERRAQSPLEVAAGHVCGSVLSARHLIAHRCRCPSVVKGQTFDLVTVVCSKDLSILRVQARSMALYLNAAFSGSIILIVNDVRPNKVISQIRNRILTEYGVWQKRVVLIPSYELGHGLDATNGWKIQQALKLAVATFISNPFYVVLDSKNHFVRDVHVSDFVTARGLARQKLDADTPTLGVHSEACARFLGLDPQDVKPCWPMTPFVFHTKTVRRLIAKLERQEQCSIFSIFKRVRFLSEFLLYKAYLCIAGVRGQLVSLRGWPAFEQDGMARPKCVNGDRRRGEQF